MCIPDNTCTLLRNLRNACVLKGVPYSYCVDCTLVCTKRKRRVVRHEAFIYYTQSVSSYPCNQLSICTCQDVLYPPFPVDVFRDTMMLYVITNTGEAATCPTEKPVLTKILIIDLSLKKDSCSAFLHCV